MAQLQSIKTPETESRVRKTAVLAMVGTLVFACAMSTYVGVEHAIQSPGNVQSANDRIIALRILAPGQLGIKALLAPVVPIRNRDAGTILPLVGRRLVRRF